MERLGKTRTAGDAVKDPTIPPHGCGSSGALMTLPRLHELEYPLSHSATADFHSGRCLR
jgi:hypothetical protein